MKLRTLDQADVDGKRVFVRCGFDVPFTADGKIADDERIRECLETLRFLIDKGAHVIIASHNGRPKGKVIESLSMKLIGPHLSELLDEEVTTLSDCIGPEVKRVIAESKPREVILLENLRFHKEEKENDPEFAKELASLADVYVDEAFANLHRDHASMTGVAKLLPAYAGFRIQKEVDALSGITDNPVHPFVAIIGGAKISDKLLVIKRMLEIGDYVLLGGALANTMLKAQGMSVGKSLVEDKMMHIAHELTLTDNRLRVPVDVVTAKQIEAGVPTKKKAVANVQNDEYILDIGPDTINLYEMILREA
ncbi:MAG: phosphoglycerate kinase, partial [Candidatus Kerfeldbacteria bacterium CG08_land_8_20_14_0_20_42_7]